MVNSPSSYLLYIYFFHLHILSMWWLDRTTNLRNRLPALIFLYNFIFLWIFVFLYFSPMILVLVLSLPSLKHNHHEVRLGGNQHLSWGSLRFLLIFSCPGSSIPDLGQSLSDWVTDRHFRISTQRVTFETSDPSDIWSEWCLDKKTERQKDKKTKRQKN